jgi:hypothetical protein
MAEEMKRGGPVRDRVAAFFCVEIRVNSWSASSAMSAGAH